MHKDAYGDPSDEVEGAEDVKCRRGAESEDGFPSVQHHEGLQRHTEGAQHWLALVSVS